MAVGAVAAASGLLPGGDSFTVSGERNPGGTVRTDGSATLNTQGEQSGEAARGDGGTAAESGKPAHAPSTSPAPATDAQRSAEPSRTAPAPAGTTTAPERKTGAPAPERSASPAPERKAERSASAPAAAPAPAKTSTVKPPARPSAPAPRPSAPSSSGPTALENEVLALVNEERAKVGCSPVRFDASLAKLAGDFSADMATRGFFSHTDPDGDTPWDRARQAGVQNLGGENIARGQADAAAVMDAWMNSDGHRANILNCDYTRLGVGVQTGSGGPWWTQNFGF